MEWLDITETRNLSYNYVTSQFGAGGAFEGWSLATISQGNELYAQFGVSLLEGSGSAQQIKELVGYIGNLSSSPDSGNLNGIVYNPEAGVHSGSGSISTYAVTYADYITGFKRLYWENAELVGGTHQNNMGSFLIRPSAVPIPSTAWLFFSSLITLAGLNRRKLN